MKSLALTLAILAAPLGAQVVHTRAAVVAGGIAAGEQRIAGIAPAPQPVYLPPGNVFVPPGMSLYGNLPVVVLTDGRVFADFGRGYEQVVNRCTTVVNTSVFPTPVVQPSVVQPTVVQPTISQPQPYTPAVPNQQTASQQMLYQANGQVFTNQVTVVNTRSCWTGSDAGVVYIWR